MIAELLALEQELEHTIAGRALGHPVRNVLSIARGYLELTLLHGDRIEVDRVVSLLADVAGCVMGEHKVINAFLVRLRSTVAWKKLSQIPDADRSPAESPRDAAA